MPKMVETTFLRSRFQLFFFLRDSAPLAPLGKGVLRPLLRAQSLTTPLYTYCTYYNAYEKRYLKP